MWEKSIARCVATALLVGGASLVWAGDVLEQGFSAPPLQSRTRCYWWWLQGNVDKAAITKDLEWMKRVGMGGGLIFHAGGAAGNMRENTPFAGPEFREQFKYAVQEADRLGLELTLTPQSGWNLGGPVVTLDQAAKHITWSELMVNGPRHEPIKLPLPPCQNGFYQEGRVIAYRLKGTVAGELARPQMTSSTAWWPLHPDVAMDGYEDTVFQFARRPQPVSADKPEWLRLDFEAPVTLGGVRIIAARRNVPKVGEWQVSDDGENFRTVQAFRAEKKGVLEFVFSAVTGRHFRLMIQETWEPSGRFEPAAQVAELALLDAEQKPLKFTRCNPPVARLMQKAAYYQDMNDSSITDPLPFTPGTEDVAAKDVLDLTDKLDAAGMLHWEAPEGRWQIMRFGGTFSGGHVSFSAGWAGPVLDHLDAGALRSYWAKVVDPLLDDIKPYLGKSFKGFETDSWEGGGMNWTARLPEEFRTRRGYDPVPYLPVFGGKIVESRAASNRFLYDWRKTIADMMADNHYGVMAKLAAERGLMIHCEAGGPHSMAFDALKNWGRCDWPMGEFWAGQSRYVMKGAASAAHIYGKPIVCGESFTSWIHWDDHLWRMQKPAFDHEACAGLNLVFWASTTCSPDAMGIPGQEMFAGTHFNPQVTWANQAQGFIGYLNRCQFMLQRGQFVADVAYYYGDQVPNIPGDKQSDPAKVLPEYDYDHLNEEMLLRMKAQDGRLVLPSGMNYRLLALPNLKTMSLEALKKVAELVKNGAAVAGARPERHPSLSGGAAAETQFNSLCEELWARARFPPTHPRRCWRGSVCSRILKRWK